jgi:hypothetical protein
MFWVGFGGLNPGYWGNTCTAVTLWAVGCLLARLLGCHAGAGFNPGRFAVDVQEVLLG